MAGPHLKIGVVAPGRSITQVIATDVRAFVAKRYGDSGPEIIFHPQCFLNEGHFAGSDAERTSAFTQMANDPELDAIWFARGGYGACRIHDEAFGQLSEAARRKTYLGYSDAGYLLARLYKEGIGTCAHGPMPADILRAGGEAALARALDFLMHQAPETLEPSMQAGEKHVAFNMTVLAHLIGTRWMPDIAGHFLLLEEVSEHYYAIDRSMFTITSSPKTRKVSGIRLGHCSEVPENDIDFGQTEEEIAQAWCNHNSIDYLGRADIGHDTGNKVVVFGEIPPMIKFG